MNSIEFASPHFLLGLIIIPLFVVWYIFNCNKQQEFTQYFTTTFFYEFATFCCNRLKFVVQFNGGD